MILIKEHNVKDAEANQILNAIAERFGYTGNDKQGFYQEWLIHTTLMEVTNHLKNKASDEAVQGKILEIENGLKKELIKK